MLESKLSSAENEREVTWPDGRGLMADAGAAARDRPTQRDRNNRGIVKTMARHPEICCVFLAIVFTLLSNYSKSNGTPIYANQPAPKRFFTSPSVVLDYPMGNLVEVGELLVDEEVLMIMYYAPWCQHSAKAKREFEKAANYLQDQVQFVGINCWYPQGACRRQNNFSSFPHFYLYHTTLDGFRYTGVMRADYMVRFVEGLLYPLTHIHSQEELVIFIATSDNVVLGHFDFNQSPQPPGYQQFYYAAMRTLELDPRNPVDYGLITNPALALSYEMNCTGTVFLVRSLNETLRYPPSRNFTSSSIVQWVIGLRQQPPVQWILPLEVKSLALSTELKKGPALILFTPSSPITNLQQYYSMLREVALDYRNCNQSSKRHTLLQTSLLYRYASHLGHSALLENCKQLPLDTAKSEPGSPHPFRPTPTKRCCASALFGNVHKLNACDVCLNYDFGHPLSGRDCSVLSLQNLPSFKTFQSLMSFDSHPCAEVIQTYNPGEFVSFCCDNNTASRKTVTHTFHNPLKTGSGVSPSSTDPYINLHSPSNLKHNECLKLRHQRRNGWLSTGQLAEETIHKTEISNFTGSGCGRNDSVHFYAMDLRKSSVFAEHLGLDVTAANHNQSVIVLVDKQNEVHYRLDAKITKGNIVKFVQEFAEGSQARHLRSTKLNRDKWCVGPDLDMCIHEVTSDTFQQVVMDKEKDVLLLYYTPWCGFCASFAHVYLALAKYFKTAKNIIFARINADRNDVPWEFTADVYPTLTLFPAFRKSESITFPDHLKLNLPTLVHFVLWYSSRALKMETGLGVCSRACLQNNMHSTAERVHLLHREIFDTERRIGQVQQKINYDATAAGRSTTAGGSSSLSSGSGSFFERTGLLHSYLRSLKRRLKGKKLQRQVVRSLHNTLLETSGFYLEKNALFSLLRLNEAMHTELQRDVSSRGDSAPINDSSRGPHDEL